MRVGKVAPLLFGSGMCALIYQVAWLREMRLIFGASTAASAAVLAVFMGGLGLGGALLGRRADRHPQPLAFYAHLELTIAVAAAVTPGLVWLARYAYIALGGSVVLGLATATGVRLLLTTLVLCVPTLLMGATLPAAAKAVETDADVGRRRLAVLYGANTLGAVTGACISTFFMLEVYGTRTTLWLACLVNVLIGVIARSAARSQGPAAAEETTPVGAAPLGAVDASDAPAPPAWFVLTAAAVVGFAFLLMELVWYRMLGPLLGGSSFTFGLILAMALLGIGLGGAAYALFDNRRPATLGGFALTCTLEAACIAYPYALGDQIAFLTIFLRPLGSFGFYGLVLGWAEVAALVVLPAAFVAGVQFPMLIALLGRGGEKVGRHVGLTYAWNTVGAILGSLAGGFGFLPALSATGTWRAVVGLLVLLGMAALVLSLRSRLRPRHWLPPVAAAATALLLLRATGPTAAWRQSPIGAGRVQLNDATRNSLHDWANGIRRVIEWAVDGVESGVALDGRNGFSFVVNGKIDGNARLDAATQVMGGLVGAILHPHPTRALVIGLGTGSTAGWLGAIPSMERVDVVELEPAILEVARACTPVNHAVLSNPKVHIFIGDAREVLLTTPQRYDIIFSEPSNPFRAGVASLFTQEFYRAVAAKLGEGGIFLQWLQAYEVDARTIRTSYATLASVFGAVETWQTHQSDLLLVASKKPITYDVPALRARVQQEPFKTALAVAWRLTGLEGFLAHYVARSSLAEAVARGEHGWLNTDDRSSVEFAFARSIGRYSLFSVQELEETARARGENRPELSDGSVDWEHVEDQRLAALTADGLQPSQKPYLTADQRQRAAALAYYLSGNLDAALAAWRAQPREPAGPVELMVVAEAVANQGDDAALHYIDQLRAFQPAEADALLGLLRWRQGNAEAAAAAVEAALQRYHDDPWPTPSLMRRAVDVAVEVATHDKALAPRLYRILSAPFSISMLNDERRTKAFTVAATLDTPHLCVEALAPLEPDIPWRRDFLAHRLRCYHAAGDPREAQAQEDLNTFLGDEPVPFSYGLAIPTPASSPRTVPAG
jgi:spermidine synthase